MDLPVQGLATDEGSFGPCLGLVGSRSFEEDKSSYSEAVVCTLRRESGKRLSLTLKGLAGDFLEKTWVGVGHTGRFKNPEGLQ